MSIRHSLKKNIAPYEMLTVWDEVLLGDKELFNELVETHVPILLESARCAIDCEQRLCNLPSYILQPEELVGETLIESWKSRHLRNTLMSLKNWLLDIQQHRLQKIIREEKKLYESVVISPEIHVLSGPNNDDEKPFLNLEKTPVHERWKDIIPDNHTNSIAA